LRSRAALCLGTFVRRSKNWKRLAAEEQRQQRRLPLDEFSETFPMDSKQPVIIVKKKGGHGGHHGGAWKVAYADFVTAMMSLFMVMWLMSSSKPVKEAISGYFKDPSGTANKLGTALSGTGENFTLTKDNMPKLKDQLEEKIRQMSDFDKLKSHVEMTVTSEGLRIELTESASGTFFDSGSSKLNADGQELLVTLAQELGKLPNKLSIEGHTDSKPYSGTGNYGNWELSSDRANAARRLMQSKGIGPDQVTQVRGFADQRLRKTDNPLDPANRRISIIVQYIAKDAEEADSKSESRDEKPSAGTEKSAESNSSDSSKKE
jgi:chemotaxis protein MotB